MRRCKLPKARFIVKILRPTVTVPGQILPIKLSVDHDNVASTAMSFPTVFLKKCEIQLRFSRHVRCAAGKYDMESIGKTIKKLASCNFSRRMHEAPSVT